MDDGKYLAKDRVYVDSGQTTSVYKVIDAKTRKTLALKEFREESEEGINIVKNEKQIQAELHHFHVCKVFADRSWRVHNDFFYAFEMEWLDRDLEKETNARLQSGNLWRDEDVVRMLIEIGGVLAEAQSKKLCHRDIKPMNIFVTNSRFFKLGDFGLSKYLYQDYVNHTLVGTPLYLSPLLQKAYAIMEQTKEFDVQLQYNPYKSDMYSLGLTALFMLSPRTNLRFQDPQYVIFRVGELQISEKLKEILKMMTEIEEQNRPDFFALEKYLRRLFPSLVREEAERMIEELISTQEPSCLYTIWRLGFHMAPIITLPCLKCKAPIPLSSLDTSQCCESCRTRDCEFCYQPFSLLDSDWRPQFASEGKDTTQLNRVCSPHCLSNLEAVRAKGAQRCQICFVWDEDWTVCVCKQHYICPGCTAQASKSDLLPGFSCAVCVPDPPQIQPINDDTQFVVFRDSDYAAIRMVGRAANRPQVFSMPIPTSLYSLWDCALCHFCSQRVRTAPDFFYLVCNNEFKVACSRECFASHTRTVKDRVVCLICDRRIQSDKLKGLEFSVRAISTAVSGFEKACCRCFLNEPEAMLNCGHHYCGGCVKTIQDRQREPTRHCPFCGHRAYIAL